MAINISSVELTNTFDEWRQRTNDIITVANASEWDNPYSALVYASSDGGLSINTITSNSVTGKLVTGVRLVFTGGNVNFTSANVFSGGNVHQVHVLGGATGGIDVSDPQYAHTSISNTFIYNSKINLNGQKFISGAADIDLEGATIKDLGSVAKLVSSAVLGGDVAFTNPRILIDSPVGSLTISQGTQDFTGATITGAVITAYTARAGLIEASNVVVNGAGFLVSTNSVALAVDAGTTTYLDGSTSSANVGIGKYPEVSGAIESEKRPTSSKGGLHIRSEFAAGGTTTTDAEAVADELVLENLDDVGMTFLSDTGSNAHIMFGTVGDSDVGSLIYNHATDSMHVVTDGANTAVFGNEYGGYMQIVGGDKTQPIGVQSGKLHINVGSTDTTTGLFIDSNDADQMAINISASQTTMNVFQIDTTTLSTGSGIGVYDNSPGVGARKIVHIIQDHADATGGTALHVETNGMIGGAFIQNKLNKTGLSVSTTTAHSVNLFEVIDDGDPAAGANTVFIRSDSSTSTQKTLEVANSSSSMMTVTAGGDVGINDNAPSYKLDVNGTLRAIGNAKIDGDLEITSSSVEADGVNCRLAVYDTSGTLLNGVDLNMT